MSGITSLIKKALGKKRGRIEKEWSFDSQSQILSSPVAEAKENGENLIAFGTKDGHLYLLDGKRVKWSYNIQEKITDVQKLFQDQATARSIVCSPVIEDINGDGSEEVLVGSDLGSLFAISSEGQLIWQYDTSGAIRSSPLLIDINNDGIKEIVFGSSDGHLYVLNNQGQPIWKLSASSGIETTPVVLTNDEGTQIIYGSNDGTVYSTNFQGVILWSFKAGGQITARATVGDLLGNGQQYIIIGSLDTNLYCLDDKGVLKWKFATEGGIHSQATLADIDNDHKLEIIFGSCDDKVYALTCSGEKIWSFETDFWVVSSPVVADIDDDGKLEVIVGSYDNSLYILDAEGTFLLNYMPGVSAAAHQPGHYSDHLTGDTGHYCGKKLWQYKTEGMIVGSAVVGKDKEIIIGTNTGKIDAFRHKDD
ncbi:MAG: PQQ-binding-like beta-propeller repeat protein [archaeon]